MKQTLVMMMLFGLWGCASTSETPGFDCEYLQESCRASVEVDAKGTWLVTDHPERCALVKLAGRRSVPVCQGRRWLASPTDGGYSIDIRGCSVCSPVVPSP